MRRIFKTAGKLHMLKDSDGQLVKDDWEHSVIVDAKYEPKPSPHQPLVVDIYGCNLAGLGQCVEKLVLDNGVILTGRTLGGSMEVQYRGIEEDADVRCRRIGKSNSTPTIRCLSAKVELDAAVFGVVSSEPLRKRACTKGVARPGYPFSYSKTFPDLHKGTWAQALRLQYHGTEITFVATSNYWKGFVDETTLQHDSIVGVRPQDGGVMGRARPEQNHVPSSAVHRMDKPLRVAGIPRQGISEGQAGLLWIRSLPASHSSPRALLLAPLARS